MSAGGAGGGGGRGLAVVTGGAGGIGRAVAERLAARGLRVVVTGRDEAALAGAARVAREAGLDVTARACDVTDEAAVEALFAGLAEPVAVLVCSAGTAASAPVERTSLADWERQLAVNATGAFLCVRATLAGMRAAGSGRIVVVASTAGLAGSRYVAGYAASKHAAVGLVRVTAAEVAGTGITANAVCPTYVRTAMTERTLERIAETTGRDRDGALAALVGSSPLGRLLEPEEVAAAVDFLASAEAAAINGQTIVVDGGELSL